MRRFLFVISALIVLVLFSFEGFRPLYELPVVFDSDTVISDGTSAPEQALEEIYYNVDTLGIKQLKLHDMSSVFDIDVNLFSAVYGRYSDGRFGIADIYIVVPKTGHEESAKEALELIKINRSDYYEDFDVYNAHEIAENGIIYQRGKYYCLIMLKDADSAVETINKYIPNY